MSRFVSMMVKSGAVFCSSADSYYELGEVSLPIFLSARGVTPFQKCSKKSCYSPIIACAFTVNQQSLSYYFILKQNTHDQPFLDSVKYKVV